MTILTFNAKLLTALSSVKWHVSDSLKYIRDLVWWLRKLCDPVNNTCHHVCERVSHDVLQDKTTKMFFCLWPNSMWRGLLLDPLLSLFGQSGGRHFKLQLDEVSFVITWLQFSNPAVCMYMHVFWPVFYWECQPCCYICKQQSSNLFEFNVSHILMSFGPGKYCWYQCRN